MRLIRDKRGVNLVYGTVIFIILNLMFFIAMFLVVSRIENEAALYEQAYAKEIALLIDSAEPGTFISLNVDDFNEFIEKKLVSEGQIVLINRNKVNIKLSNGAGYSFIYFSDYDVGYSIRHDKDELYLDLLIKEKTK